MIDRDAIAVAAEGGEVRFDEPMASHTTLGVGGPADVVAWPETVKALRMVRALCSRHGWPCWALGGGSNLLVRDGGVRGVVLATTRLRRLERVGQRSVVAEAGVPTGELLSAAAAWDLGGLEFLAGIPGTVGGGVVMNAGTPAGEFKDVVSGVTSICHDGAPVDRDRAGLGFRYRGSAIGAEEVVVSARLELTPRPRAEIEALVATQRERRRGKEPHGVRCAGSIFKNPPEGHAGRLIEHCGLRGRRAGGAEISPVHANWIVNRSGATAADILTLIAVCQEEVERRFGVRLELEVKVVADDER
jgi:UDP-N-acetylmuramate dehydrogenase